MPYYIPYLTVLRTPMDRVLTLLDSVHVAALQQVVLVHHERLLQSRIQSELWDIEDAIASLLHSIKTAIDTFNTSDAVQRLDMSRQLTEEFYRLEKRVADVEDTVCRMRRSISYHHQILANYRISLSMLPHVIREYDAPDAVPLEVPTADGMIRVLDRLMLVLPETDRATRHLTRLNCCLSNLTRTLRGLPFDLEHTLVRVTSMAMPDVSLRARVSGMTNTLSVNRRLAGACERLRHLANSTQNGNEDFSKFMNPILGRIAVSMYDSADRTYSRCKELRDHASGY